MNTNIQIFKNEVFGEIRTITNDEGEIFFVGKDVAMALGYKNPSNALQVHVDSEDKTSYLIQVSGSNYKANTLFVNESGLYALILSSKLEQARQFKRWITSEVLPQIRRTGGYIPTHDSDGRKLSGDEILSLADEIISYTLQELNQRKDDCLTATEVAMLLGWDVHLFNAVLADMGIQHRHGGRWVLAEELHGRGLTEDRHFYCYSLKGKPRLTTYLTWTAKGVSYLGKRLGAATVLNARAVEVMR